ncbi:AAA family ATPase [Burkholderia cepacia]|uniref:chloramphenicol phosphotransferase CPT family protein n=1 Tax=Burkholderia TaxID=32008 RepID=UPI002AB67681|nr:AAA family ATPase [Burkholderia cepacia]
MPYLQQLVLPQPARVIVLNGASSAGKTTLAKAMQALWGAPLHHVQLDAFRDMEPPDYWTGWEGREKMETELMLCALCCAMYAAVGEYAKYGQEVVLDTVLSNARARHLLVENLAHIPVYLIAVKCDAAELARRESARSDRSVGLAASQVDWIHKSMQYDFEVDTTGKEVDKVAAEISNWLADNPLPLAFERLNTQLNSG